ncbi:expressed unknown protein [Seminavis robusta]|uniref:Photosystem II 12 kDa extrinsic protein n=1 Tax=Seminavis robusta TaxID=568900 RepID=A0A9N8HUA4_9STRA|nr:expressed unknown protein [Seminavis robusta]|eukprot:Sro1786_g297420.1 n/a (190) ;mRNA; f:8821-9390
MRLLTLIAAICWASSHAFTATTGTDRTALTCDRRSCGTGSKKSRPLWASMEDSSSSFHTSRRDLLQSMALIIPLATMPAVALAGIPSRMDVNNALAREYTAFPGLYPTVATKIVKGAPYKSKKEVYAVLNEVESERLKQYDRAIVIEKPDAQLKQFKTSQICKYECGSRASSAYRDEQIKAVQKARSVY